MLYSRFFKSLKPPLYVGLEVDTQQLNVPTNNVAYMIHCINRTYMVLSYFSLLKSFIKDTTSHDIKTLGDAHGVLQKKYPN